MIPVMKKKTASPKSEGTKASHKLGANRHDPARRQQKRDKNFKQSKDVREDRGVRQLKTKPKKGGQGADA